MECDEGERSSRVEWLLLLGRHLPEGLGWVAGEHSRFGDVPAGERILDFNMAGELDGCRRVSRVTSSEHTFLYEKREF